MIIISCLMVGLFYSLYFCSNFWNIFILWHFKFITIGLVKTVEQHNARKNSAVLPKPVYFIGAHFVLQIAKYVYDIYTKPLSFYISSFLQNIFIFTFLNLLQSLAFKIIFRNLKKRGGKKLIFIMLIVYFLTYQKWIKLFDEFKNWFWRNPKYLWYLYSIAQMSKSIFI